MASLLTSRLPSPWRTLWQMPVLLLGVGVFAYGVYNYGASRPKVPFAVQVGDVRGMLAQQEYQKALEHIAAIEQFYPAAEEQSELLLLKGDAFYLAQQRMGAVVEENCRKAIGFYAASGRDSVEVRERWGLLALAIGEYGEAIKKLEGAVGTDGGMLRKHARSLVQAYMNVVPREEGKALGVLEQLSGLRGEGTVDDRAWALCKRIEIGLASGSKPVLEKAIADAGMALADTPEHGPHGMLRLWLGRAELERGKLDEAKAHLAAAREKFRVRQTQSLDDGRAALLLGKVAQAQGDYKAAKGLYQEVITRDAGTPFMAAAVLGRAEVSATLGSADAQVRADYELVIRELLAAADGKRKEAPEFVTLETVRESLRHQQVQFAKAERFQDALMFLDLLNTTRETRTVDTDARRAETEERRGDELVMLAEGAKTEAQRNALLTEAIAHYGSAADAYLRHSRGSALDDDRAAESMWKAAQLFDKAGRTERSIEIYNRYVLQWPRDRRSRVPEALHRIGMLYQSLGKFSDAARVYARNVEENPKTTWSYQSTVQLARCYVAMGDEHFDEAEKTLLRLVEGTSDLQPVAAEFRQALFALGELYYRQKQWSDAILRLEEAIDRYKGDAGIPRATFWLADCYRKSAGDIRAAIAKNPQIEGRDRLERAQQDRLRQAAMLFGRVISMLEPEETPGTGAAATRPTLPAIEEDYLRYSYMYRADCHFELGDYAGAIKLYDQAAMRLAQTAAAVEAYVQIVNAYLAMNEPGQARAAAERALWMLKRIPDEAFGRGAVGMTRKQYEEFLKLGRGAGG